MDFITGPGSAKSKVRNLASSVSEQFYFHRQAYIILQTVPVCNAYAQINPGKGNTDRKSRTATAQWEFLRSYGPRNKPRSCLYVH